MIQFNRLAALILTNRRLKLTSVSIVRIAAERAGIGLIGSAAAIRAEIGLAADKGPRPHDNGIEPTEQGAGGQRLDDEFIDPGVARLNDAGPVGMPGDHHGA